MSTGWPPLRYESWSATSDTLHAHAQVLGKLAVELAPPEPQLQHAALRLTARGWETLALPAPDGSGAIVAALDLRTHEASVEHSDGRETRIALTPNRPVAEVTRELLEAVERLGGKVAINPTPQEVPWTTPLDEDDQHATYDADQAATYFVAATQAALVLADVRAPFRGRATPVNAWWGTFDLAVNFFSGRPADPPSDDFINAIVAALDRLLQANASAGTLRPDLDSGDVVLASSPGGELARADRTALAERERGVHQREVAERLGKVAELAAGHRVVLLCEQTDVVA